VKVSHVVVVIALGAAVLAGCDGDGNGDAENDPPGAPQDLELTVTADEFRFVPASFRTELDQEVDLTFTNDDTTSHTFTAEEVSLDIEAAAGTSNTATFVVPDDDVVIEWACRFHPEMTGQIFVGDPQEAGEDEA
jgi:plastocyanin